MFHAHGRLWSALVLAICLFPAAASAQTTIGWDPSPNAVGYTVRWGTALGVYTKSSDAGNNTSFTLTNLTPGGTYWAVVEAYGAAGEYSDPSAPLQFVAPPPLDPALSYREHARADFDGDGLNDLLWQDSQNGYLAAWLLTGTHAVKAAVSLSHGANDQTWRIVGTGDFNTDGKPDIVWHNNASGNLRVWYMDGVTRTSQISIDGVGDTRWRVAGIGDFNGDQKPDIIWQHDTAGWLAVWLMNGPTLIGGLDMTPVQVDVQWKIAGTADLNADGKTDLVWRNINNGEVGAWLMNGVNRIRYVPITPQYVDKEWRIASVVDVDGDQTPDLVWHHVQQGWVAVWYMQGTARRDARSFPIAIETIWQLVGPK
jgi:hypothetical protein